MTRTRIPLRAEEDGILDGTFKDRVDEGWDRMDASGCELLDLSWIMDPYLPGVDPERGYLGFNG